MDDDLSQLLERYAAGHTTPAERAQLARLMGTAPDAETEVAIYQHLIQQSTGAEERSVERAEAQVAVQRIRAMVTNDPKRNLPLGHFSGPANARARFRAGPMMIATAVAMIAVGFFGLASPRSWHTGQPFREFASAAGSRTTVTLRDGTRLVLGPASRLRISGDFGRSNRVVQLDGEALFTVVHDAAHPFAVRTARAVFHDIGTTFAVQAYQSDAETRVAVVEGQVGLEAFGSRVASQRSQPVLSAREGAVVDAAGHVIVQSDIDLSASLAWMQGRLVFDKTPLPRVVAELERTFNITIRLADSTLVTRSITASFDNESANEVLDDITRALGARYERSGRAVVIRRGTAAVGHPATPSPVPALVTARSSSLPQ